MILSLKQRIDQALNNHLRDALMTGADVLIAESMDFIPVSAGYLRSETEVDESEKDENSVTIKSGGERSGEYAARQYFGNLRHLFEGGKMKAVIDLAKGRGMAEGGDKYWQGLKAAEEQGRLTRFTEGAKWFERALQQKSGLTERVQAAITGYLNENLVGELK